MVRETLASETAVAEVEEQKDSRTSSDDAPRRKTSRARRNRGNLPESLPRIERVVEPDSLMCPCGCGQMHRIGVVPQARLRRDDRTERLDIVPAQLRVIVTVQPKYACRACTDGVTQAPAPAALIEGGLPTEGAIAHRAGPHSADSLAAVLRLVHLRHAARSRPLSPAWASRGVRPSRAECGLSLL